MTLPDWKDIIDDILDIIEQDAETQSFDQVSETTSDLVINDYSLEV